MRERGALLAAVLVVAAAAATNAAVAEESMVEEQKFFESSCGGCHPASIFLVDLTPEKRRHVVTRMRDRWEGGTHVMSEQDVERILAYVENRAASGAALASTGPDAEPKALFRERCAGCHDLDRVYAQVKAERGKPAAWLHVVTRMRGKAPDWISEEDAKKIVDYLRSRTTPKATE